MDVTPGGLIRILTKDEKLNSSLLWEIKKHTPHHYASNLYELFIKTCNDQVYSYQQLIINNTRKLYNLFHENELTTKMV